VADDLPLLLSELSVLDGMSSEQANLANWLRSLPAETAHVTAEPTA
jgi:hypothetical protein